MKESGISGKVLTFKSRNNLVLPSKQKTPKSALKELRHFTKIVFNCHRELLNDFFLKAGPIVKAVAMM